MPEFVTHDMALTTFLNMMGHRHQRMERTGGDKVLWYFDRSDVLTALVGAYQAGASKVEPKQFTVELANVRQELVKFKHG